jgi:menaquinone-dependent protoporphyrinogen IX oxidase
VSNSGGTGTGTAEDVTDYLAAALEEFGIEMEIVNMEEALSKEGYKSSSSMLSA